MNMSNDHIRAMSLTEVTDEPWNIRLCMVTNGQLPDDPQKWSQWYIGLNG